MEVRLGRAKREAEQNARQSKTRGRKRSNYLNGISFPSSGEGNKRKPLEMARTFTAELVMKAIKSCITSKAFGPVKLGIFHLNHLGPRAIEYITTLFNLSVTTCQISAILKSSLIIPIPKPGKDTSQRTSYGPISLLCPAAKVPESLLLPTINKYLLPAQGQHGFRREHSHSTTSVLLQLTTYIAVGFNQRKPPERTVCVTVDLSAAFDRVCHNNLLSKINRSQLPPATARWISCYPRGRQAMSLFQGRKVNTSVPQGSKLSLSLFSVYIADMPRPTNPVKRVCYADDLTVWTSGVNILDLEVSINNYLEEITAYLKDKDIEGLSGPLLIIQQAHPVCSRERESIRQEQHPKGLGGTSWGQQKETLLITYKAIGRSIINYAATVWSPNLHDTNY